MDVETLKLLDSLATKFGVPTVIIAAVAVFVAVKVWPWWTARIAERDAAKAKRDEADAKTGREKDAAYIEAIRANAAVNERVAAAITKVGERLDSQPIQKLVELVVQHTEKTDLQHGQIIDRLGDIDRAVRG